MVKFNYRVLLFWCTDRKQQSVGTQKEKASPRPGPLPIYIFRLRSNQRQKAPKDSPDPSWFAKTVIRSASWLRHAWSIVHITNKTTVAAAFRFKYLAVKCFSQSELKTVFIRILFVSSVIRPCTFGSTRFIINRASFIYWTEVKVTL
jgi:hypothetical protein